MKKIKSLFVRDHSHPRALITPVINDGCEWVVAGEGVATRKWDGTACLVREGLLLKRYDAKNGKAPPHGFEPAQDPDPVTKHWPGWLIVGNEPEAKWHREAWDHVTGLPDGTYELIGPKINANRDGAESHQFKRHGDVTYEVPRDFDGLRSWLEPMRIEGLVFHHPDGRMAKLTRNMFGFAWPEVLP